MSSISSLFTQGQLAEASYADLRNSQVGSTITDPQQVKARLLAVGFSDSQAAALVSQWRVVNHIPDTASGFSATLFERLDANEQPTGQYTFAIRGSTEFIDFAGADLSLATGGVAFDQLLSMVNYVLRLQAGVNGTTQQIELAAGATAPSLTSNFVSGVGPSINPAELTISGHSLGGFLGQVYQRLFGSIGVYTYNALGLIRPNAPIFDQLTSLLGLPPGSFSSGPGENLLVPGEPAQLIGTVQGKPQIRVFSETQSTTIGPVNTIPAHRVSPLTDSLAVYDLFAKLDPALNTTDPAVGIGKITDILTAASNKPALSLEAALDSLRKLFKDAVTADPIPTAMDNRERYYQNLIGLQDRIALYVGTLTIDSLATTSDVQLAGLAQGSDAIAYRYALKELNPFAIVGNNDLYSPHNVNGELNLYSPVTGTGLTREYLADRAEMLGWKNLSYQKDGNVALRGDRIESYQFTDKSIKDDRTGQDLTLTVVGRNSLLINNPARIIFGSDSDETLAGSNIAAGDHLYGGGGADTLQGNQGNDYLEGGNGNDTYVWNSGDGIDTILDTDGIGKLVVNGKVISGGIKVAQNDYVSTDKQTLHFEGDPIAGGVLIVNGDLRIENFTSGDLGIVLNEQGNLAEIQPTTTTFQGPVQTSADFFGSDGADRFVATLESSLFVAKGGDDLLQVSDGALGPRIAGGSGRDLLIGGSHEGVASVLGEAGQDILLGGDHPDQLVGDFFGFEFSDFGFRGSSFSYSEAPAEDPDEVSTPRGYFTSPIQGIDDADIVFADGYFQALKYVLGIDDASDISSHYDDYLDGGGGNDFLFGGYGSDVLFGGAGNDSIDGDAFAFGLLFNLGGFRDSIWRDAVARLFGQPGDDYFDGGGGNDRLVDQDGGNDVLIGAPGDDYISSGEPDSAGTTYSNYLEGGEGNDVITSSNRSPDGFDVLIGGPGNDTFQVDFGSANIEGGAGGDTYIVTDRFSPSVSSRLPRNVVINDFDNGESDVDRLHLRALADLLTTLSITRDESHLYIGRSGDPGWITVENWFAGPEYKIEEIVFDNVSTPGFDQVYDVAAIESRFTTTSAAADFLWGSSADEQLAGGLGTDTLFGDAGNDFLAGNEGNDALDGGEGSDVYVFNVGDGVDHILDTGSFGSDAITFGPGITPEMLTLGLGSLLITVGENGDAIHIEGFDPNNARNSSGIELFQFADGVQLTYGELVTRGFDIVGTAADDVLQGTSVNDRFAGGVGNDTYLFGRGSGQDVIEDLDTAGLDTDTVRVGADCAPTDIAITRMGDFITLAFNGAGDQLSIRWQPEQGYGIERVEFSGGIVWDAETLEAIVRSSSNSAPMVANPLMDQTAQEDVPFGFQVPEDAFRDMDQGEILSYSAALANGDALPAWLAFDSASRQFIGTPAANDIGAISVRVTATDLMGASATDEFQLVVSDGGECREMNLVGSDECDNRNYDHWKRDDEHRRSSHGRKHVDRDDHRLDRKDDRIADFLSAHLERKPRYDFETLALELEHADWIGEAPNGQEIARRWQVVGGYLTTLANERDEDARGGADYRFSERGLLGGDIHAGGLGYSESIGLMRRMANLQALQGLEEGFQRLHT